MYSAWYPWNLQAVLEMKKNVSAVFIIRAAAPKRNRILHDRNGGELDPAFVCKILLYMNK